MKVGKLGLPLPIELEPGRTVRFQVLNSSVYYDFARRHEIGKAVSKRLLADNRYQAIDGKSLSNGEGAFKLSLDHLTAWYVFRANEVGIEIADHELNAFLNATEIDLLAVLWLYGVTTKSRITFHDSIELVPIEQMPTSQEKFDYQQSAYSYQSHELPSPQAALVKRVAVSKIDAGIGSPGVSDAPRPGALAQTALNTLSILMNAVPGVCCMSGYATFYSLPGTPTGSFGGTGGGSVIFDTLPRKRSEFSSQHAELLSHLAQKFETRSNVQKQRLEAALHRLAQAKGRFDAGDVCLDLGIALEMVLLNTEHENQELPGQLSLHFRLRGSWLLGATLEERRKAYTILGKIYSLRSKIAHNGFSNDLFRMPYKERDLMLSDHISVGEKVLQTLILKGTPTDWAAVVLGATEQP